MINVPNVKTPMNFGIEYLGSPSHGNLRFLLDDNEELLSHSAIMSFNSPVIKKMTLEDGRTTVDVQEFSKEAVLCFLGASYSGTLGNISKTSFRDVNKIANVFNVTWLADRCFDYFKSLTDAVTEDVIADQVYVFEEAMLVSEKLKKRDYIEYVISKFSSLATCTEDFVMNYLSDISSCSPKNLDMIMEMTKEQQHILVKVLINNLGIEGSSLNENSRSILEILNFNTYPPNHEPLYRDLLEKLELINNPSVEDYRLIVRTLRESNKARKENTEGKENTHGKENAVRKELNTSAGVANLPNLFHNFKPIQEKEDLDKLKAFLTSSSEISSSYVFYDAVYCWLINKKQGDESPSKSITDSFIKSFVDKKEKKKWNPLAQEYTERTNTAVVGLSPMIKQKSSLITSSEYYRVTSALNYTPEELFARNHDLKFLLKHDCDCGKEGDCGFILRVTAASGKLDDSFNIQLLTDPSLYPDDIHLHEDFTVAENMHLAIDIKYGDKSFKRNRPITWDGKPYLDRTSKYWQWGRHRFWKQGEGQNVAGEAYSKGWCWGSTAKLWLTVFYSTCTAESPSWLRKLFK